MMLWSCWWSNCVVCVCGKYVFTEHILSLNNVLRIVNLITPFNILQLYPSSFHVTWSFTIQSGVSFLNVL